MTDPKIFFIFTTVISILFGGAVGRYLENNVQRFPEPYQTGSNVKLKFLKALIDEANREEAVLSDYDQNKNDPMYQDQQEENSEILAKSVNPPVNYFSNSHKEEKRKPTIRKACK